MTCILTILQQFPSDLALAGGIELQNLVKVCFELNMGVFMCIAFGNVLSCKLSHVYTMH